MGSRIQPKLLQPGNQAPDFALTAPGGVTQTLENVLAGGPAVLVFFKISCPVCQYAFPFLERLHKSAVRLFGVSQDNAADTAAFAAEFGITFPMLRDESAQSAKGAVRAPKLARNTPITAADGSSVLRESAQSYPASNNYGISHVPSIFLIQPDGRVAMAWDGFSKADMEALGQRFSAEVFHPGEKVPQWKPG